MLCSETVSIDMYLDCIFHQYELHIISNISPRSIKDPCYINLISFTEIKVLESVNITIYIMPMEIECISTIATNEAVSAFSSM